MLPSTLFGMVKHFFQLYSFVSLGDTLVPLELFEVLLEIVHLLLYHAGHELHLHHLCMHFTQVFLGMTESCFNYS